MTSWAKIKFGGLILIIFTLAACSIARTTTEQVQPLPETNPFEKTESGEGIKIGGYGAGLEDIDPFKGDVLTYDGNPIQLSYFLQGTGSNTEVGLMLFLDGVPQPHRVVKNNQQDDLFIGGQKVLMTNHRVSGNGRTEFTVEFTPVTGSSGEEIGLHAIFLFEPSFVPKTESQTFGVYHDGRFQIPLSVIMKTDAPSQAENYAVSIETTPIPQSEKINDELNPSGRISQPHFLFYSGESYYPNKLVAKNSQIELTTSIYGGVEADYRITIFVNHQPIMIGGHHNFLMRTHYDQISTYRFTLDLRNYNRINSLYAVIIPVGQSYKDENIYGKKTDSILLVNDVPDAAVETIRTLSAATIVPTIPSLLRDTDLTSWLTENQVSPNYGQPGIHLVNDSRLLVWFDSAALFDIHSGTLLHKVDITTGPVDQKVEFTEDVTGVFRKENGCMECTVILDRYDVDLNLISSTDLSQIFDLRMDILRPFQCALSQSGHVIACAKSESRQILMYDLETHNQTEAFDISKSNLTEFRGFNSIAFVGNDGFLAFTAIDSNGYGFGIIALDNRQLASYTKWDAVADEILTTRNSVYFHEQLKSPNIQRSGKILKINLDTLEQQEIQLANEEESKFLTVSRNGKYIVTVQDTANPGSNYVAGTIKIYDGETMQLIRQINLERGFPRLVIDEANRSLFAYYFADGTIKLFRYVF